MEGSIRDLSACGMGLLIRQAIPPGATLLVGPLGSEATLLPAHVVRHTPVGKLWQHGCALDRRLSEDELSTWLA
jgi:hypothetical protein